MNNLLFITGAGSGIGKETSITMSSAYENLILVGRDMSKLQSVKNSITKKNTNTTQNIHTYSCDLAKEKNITSMIKSFDHLLQTVTSFTLINNAAISNGYKNFEDSCSEEWAHYFQINLMGTVNLTKKLLPYMQPKPATSSSDLNCINKHSIVNIASTAGTRVVSGLSAYGSLKAALIYWSNTIALELGEKGIRVNTVCPGIIDTPIHPFYSETEKQSEEYNNMAQAQVLNRIGQPKDVVEAIEYLCKTSWVTGSVLTVDGGISI